MTKRLNAALNFICTYEKAITINSKIVDVIEEFSATENKVVLYGYHNTYEFIFSNVEINVSGAGMNIQFCGKNGGVISWR